MQTSFKIFSVSSASLLLGSVAWGFGGALSLLCGRSLIVEWEIFSLSSSMISVSLVFDWMSLFFLMSVCLIAGVVMKYSEYYMKGEVNFVRFFYLLSLFVMSMWVLIISPNLISLLLGWDGLGLTSYALVIYYQNELSCNAGMLTALSNRVGDVALLLSVGLMFGEGGWDFYNGFYKVEGYPLLLVILASFTKSAQIPFSAWLPAAMAAPTPVSALVHSSTLVTAGVYLLIRFSDSIQKSGMGGLLFSVAGLTMLMAALAAVSELDMKKVVALSTLSQLGLMIMVLGSGSKELAFFHLITHAMFKSSLFMCVGFVIHSCDGVQDGRQVSGFGLSSPALSVMLGTTNLALCGFPFLAGFYSKDVLLECVQFSAVNFSFVCLIMTGVGLTVAYSLRLVYATAVGVSASGSVSSLSDFSVSVAKPVSILFLASLSSGFLMQWMVMPLEAPWLLSDLQKHVILLVGAAGGVSAYAFLQMKDLTLGKGAKVLEAGFSLMWFLSELVSKLSVSGPLVSGLKSHKVLDLGWFEYFGGQGGRTLSLSASGLVQSGQSGLALKSFLITVFLSFFFTCLVI